MLTDTAVRTAKPRAKAYKMGDAQGLFLLVQPAGGKWWRLKYRVDRREKMLAIGTYPEIGLSEARKRRDAARAVIAAGKDPSLEKQREKARGRIDAANSFVLIATEFCEKRKGDGHRGWAERTVAKNAYLLSLLTPAIGRMPIVDIEPQDVLAAVRKIEARGTREAARRALQLASGVFRYAVATARLASDPTRDLRGALLSPESKPHAAIIDPGSVGGLLRAIDGYQGNISTKLALELAPHVFVRPGELRQACWEEFDLDNAVWALPSDKMKMRKPHQVPLSRQSLEILRRAKAQTSRREGYVFPSIRTSARPLSENTLNAALRRLGYTTDEMTAHGFRAMASTLLNESGKWSVDAIERGLAHGDSDKVRAVYHRGAHWEERVQMAQWWSDYLDQLRQGIS
jgi:integrase